MTPEDRNERIERQLEFLAASQAQHDVRMAEISKNIVEITKTNAAITRTNAEIAQRTEENSRQISENTSQIGQLGQLTLTIGRIVEQQAHRMDDLTERLSALINVVERYFSNGRK